MKFVIPRKQKTAEEKMWERRQIKPEDLFSIEFVFNEHHYVVERYSKSQYIYYVDGVQIPHLRSNSIAAALVNRIKQLESQNS
jgi:hypothetical protein